MNTQSNETTTRETGPTCCGMSHEPGQSHQAHAHDNKAACHCNLENGPATEKKQGVVRRWLNRMAKANQKTFGPSGPRCCGG